VFNKLLLTLTDISSSSDKFEQSAKLKIGVRLPLEISPEDWFKQLNEILDTSGIDNRQMIPTNNPIPAWKGKKNSALVRAFLKGIRENGGKPSFVYKTGTADINIVAQVWRCPAVVYGPGDSRLDHTPFEHIELEEYAKSVRVLVAALKHLVSE